ncbi:conditioned medium factor receptor 1-like [Branchiostoma floridae]|uniref:Conditioned medium factor receptor 1-like n=1 Tax=Branchiostoma floridae TaxID=7739 RepID=A0A9J7LWH7_BRAFL|nr:conditioned medium factor receptor 1-like [Branchiostoma floridae]
MQRTKEGFYDVAVVGAGPAGSTLGYYLAKAGRNCLLLEKKKFPRDKYCGDAVCKTAIEILMDMGIYEKLIKENKARIVISMLNALLCYRVLVCADGAPSKLATKLGIVKRPPDGSCSRAYVESGTHKFKADGCIFYHRDMLPGYSALFRHPNNELNYCVYLIPGNPKVTNDDLPYWHNFLMKQDPNISKSLGPGAKLERMKAASLRLGGEPVSHGDHVLVVGDAAGMIDPMTGEGIHHAMEAGKMAAKFLDEAMHHGNYDKDVMKLYHEAWMDKFGSDFKWSFAICQLLYRFPILLDAATAAIARKGDKFLAAWADIMTGRVPKIHLLRPEFVIVITFELVSLIIKRAFGIEKKREKKLE